MIPLLVHGLGITVLTTVILVVTLFPFLPGRYDSLAIPLSLMSQLFGTVGLLLVPVGALWILAGYCTRLAGTQYGIAMAALVVSSLVWAIMSVGALVSSGFLLAVCAVALWIAAFSIILPRLKPLKTAPPRGHSATGFYLAIVPAVVAVAQMVAIAPAIEFSRNRAIRNSAPLIAAIERYRSATGHYPRSLLSVWEDYLPGIIGIREYHYEPSDEAYNLFFEQFALHFGTREFVMYNPLDEQAMTSHKMDRLQWSAQELAVEQTRGHYAVHEAAHPHWKYFWFD